MKKYTILALAFLLMGCEEGKITIYSDASNLNTFPQIDIEVVCDHRGYAYSRTYGSHGEINYIPIFENNTAGNASVGARLVLCKDIKGKI